MTDRRYAQWGIDNLKRMESFNDSPAFIRCLADLAAAHLRGEAPSTRQLYMRCPCCPNDTCRVTKEFIAAAETRKPHS